MPATSDRWSSPLRRVARWRGLGRPALGPRGLGPGQPQRRLVLIRRRGPARTPGHPVGAAARPQRLRVRRRPLDGGRKQHGERRLETGPIRARQVAACRHRSPRLQFPGSPPAAPWTRAAARARGRPIAPLHLGHCRRSPSLVSYPPCLIRSLRSPEAGDVPHTRKGSPERRHQAHGH